MNFEDSTERDFSESEILQNVMKTHSTVQTVEFEIDTRYD